MNPNIMEQEQQQQKQQQKIFRLGKFSNKIISQTIDTKRIKCFEQDA